jgi:hypothetical protein
MPDSKIINLGENTTPISTDVMEIEDDPAGTNVSQKIQLVNLMALFANPVSDDGDSLGTTSLKWSDVFLASGAVADFNSGNVTVTHSAGKLTVGGSQANGVGVVLAGGGTALAPLQFTSGTNLSTPVAGGMEYDGKVFYSSHVASARGVAVSTQVGVIDSDFTMSSTTVAQACFPAGYDVWSLNGSTTYRFEGAYYMTMGTTSTSTGMLFALGGSLTSIRYYAHGMSGATNTTTTAQSSVEVDVATNTNILPASTTSKRIVFSGIMRVNGAGTVTPQIQFSTAPGTTVLMKANSYIMFTPLGSNTMTRVGNVA